MTKAQFAAYCKKIGLTCKYSGNTRTMYVSGQNAPKLLKHSTEVLKANFKVVTK